MVVGFAGVCYLLFPQMHLHVHIHEQAFVSNPGPLLLLVSSGLDSRQLICPFHYIDHQGLVHVRTTTIKAVPILLSSLTTASAYHVIITLLF